MPCLLAISIIDSWRLRACNRKVEDPTMRWNGCPITIALAAALAGVARRLTRPVSEPWFLSPARASDIALDETRGLLYIADFTASESK